MRLLFTLLFMLSAFALKAQHGSITGKVLHKEGPLVGAVIYVASLNKGATADINGRFLISNIPIGKYELRISMVGYRTLHRMIEVTENATIELTETLEEDPLNLEQVVVSATRSELPKYNAPVMINTISPRIFSASQALSVAEGLHFSPGLRVENNCNNCGFTQLRMNGLDGPYSQVLINSRPVFSALAGVYGLEILPANMINRVEVVRGGGSVLYGGNAIAGTVNIITREPDENRIEVSYNQAFINGQAPDHTLSINGALINKEGNSGISFFGFNRQRAPWDANQDGFSEITQLRNSTFGVDAFWNTSKRSKLKFNTWLSNEFRRGGNGFDKSPHQTDVAEQLQHNIINANASFETYSADYRHKLSVYNSTQIVQRQSYYGAGGRVLTPDDTLTLKDILAINAYGQSNDVSNVLGVQYAYDWRHNLTFTIGSEFQYNRVEDNMPGYDRSIQQTVGTLGNYLQFQWLPVKDLTLLLGGRFDRVGIQSKYALGESLFTNDEPLTVAVPRVAAMYNLSEQLKLRLSYAQGYRAPQAFDEDLHIATVGGAARFIQLAQDLSVEKSESYNASLVYTAYIGNWQSQFTIEGFHTRLRNPFILSGQTELPNGVAVITKRNGGGASVQGINLENNLALGKKWLLQGGATIQSALYEEEEKIWTPENEEDNELPPTFTHRILRTPNVYGYLSIISTPNNRWEAALTGVFTGRMDVPHVINPENEYTIIRRTPTFFEQNIKLSYNLLFSKNQDKSGYLVQVVGGIQNLFNQYQRDFDRGMFRDAGYVYGPMRPRTYYMGIKLQI
jgi:outer membrane receptor for ferrienterochelin and colicins